MCLSGEISLIDSIVWLLLLPRRRLLLLVDGRPAASIDASVTSVILAKANYSSMISSKFENQRMCSVENLYSAKYTTRTLDVQIGFEVDVIQFAIECVEDGRL